MATQINKYEKPNKSEPHCTTQSGFAFIAAYKANTSQTTHTYTNNCRPRQHICNNTPCQHIQTKHNLMSTHTKAPAGQSRRMHGRVVLANRLSQIICGIYECIYMCLPCGVRAINMHPIIDDMNVCVHVLVYVCM